MYSAHPMITEIDISFLHRAVRLAVKGHGTVEPNPMVGCIITNKEGEIVGEGFHEKFGEAHAEVNALTMAGESACGGTAYVTLEPCSHHGKTPPCSQALLDSGIARVVIGAVDPHKEANGGAVILRDHGIDVEIVNDAVCSDIIAPFLQKNNTGLPWITCKWAQTSDGNIETSKGDSPWISCKESQQLVHEERGCVDAIVVGVGTVIADNPTLTVRGATKYRTPVRVVIDPALRTPLHSNVLNRDAPTLIAHVEGADTTAFCGHEVFALPINNGVMNLKPLFRHLSKAYNATNVLAEGGATLFEHIFSQNLANELWIFTAAHRSILPPRVNMNTLVDSLTTTLIDEQPSGVDSVTRLLVTPLIP